MNKSAPTSLIFVLTFPTLSKVIIVFQLVESQFTVCLLAEQTGLHELKQELKKDFSREKINTLCTRKGKKITVICFQSAGSLSAFADKFYLMNQEHTSDLFTVEWREAMHAALHSGAALTVADIHPKVWVPAFRNCQFLLDELHDCSMKLSRIDVCFRQHKHDLELQLKKLFLGVNACLGENKNGGWIKGVVRRIHDYWHLYNYQKAATTFLQLRDVLSLKGDFRNVEILATEVSRDC